MEIDFTPSTFDDEPYQPQETFAPTSSSTCPVCQSRHVVRRETAKKAGAIIGTVAGVAGGISGALSGAITGAEFGLAAATPLGMVAGAVLGGLSGGVAGCVVGAALGEAVDDAFLRNRRCLGCGHTFRLAPLISFAFSSRQLLYSNPSHSGVLVDLITPELRVRLLANGQIARDNPRFDPWPVAKWFNPCGAATWLITELDPDDEDLAYGLMDLGWAAPRRVMCPCGS